MGKTKSFSIVSTVTLALLLPIFACSRKALSPGFVEEATHRSVAIYADGGPVAIGSGVIVDRVGHIVTCSHVLRLVRNQVEVEYEFKRIPAEIVDREDRLDLAVLHARIESALPAVSWAPDAPPDKGEPVYLVGSPYGLTGTLMAGIVSHPDRTGLDMEFPKIAFIQTQGLSYPGTSGAGVFLRDGRYIGINRATYGLAPMTGIGLTTPAKVVQAYLEKVLEGNK